MPTNLFVPEVIADPYPVYREMLRTAPLFRAAQGFWVVSRYADAVSLLNDPRCDHWGQDGTDLDKMPPLEAALAHSLHLLSPGAATPFRRAAMQAVAAQMAGPAVSESARFADAILLSLTGSDRFDVIADFGHPFTFRTVCRMMGLSEAEGDALNTAIAALPQGILQCVSPDAPHSDSSEGPEMGVARFLAGLIAKRRSLRGDDLISKLAEADAVSGSETGDGRLVNLLIVLLHAGHQNMMNFIGNAVLALARDPDCLALIRRTPALIAGGVDELLRFDSPVQFIPLISRDAITLYGEVIKPGEGVWICVGAANRDPAAFSSPDRLDLGRNAQRHLSFGQGAWRCVGARLAQLTGAVALERFFAHVAQFQVADESLRWRSHPIVQRGLAAFPIERVRYA